MDRVEITSTEPSTLIIYSHVHERALQKLIVQFLLVATHSTRIDTIF